MTTTTFILSEYFPVCANKGLCYLKLRGKYQMTSSSGGGGGGGGSSSSSSNSNSNKLLYLHDRIILQYCKSMYMAIKI